MLIKPLSIIVMLFSPKSFALSPEKFELTQSEKNTLISYVNDNLCKEKESKIENFQGLEYGKESKLFLHLKIEGPGIVKEGSLMALLVYELFLPDDPNIKKIILKHLNHIKHHIKTFKIEFDLWDDKVDFWNIFLQIIPKDKEEIKLIVALYKTLKGELDEVQVNKLNEAMLKKLHTKNNIARSIKIRLKEIKNGLQKLNNYPNSMKKYAKQARLLEERRAKTANFKKSIQDARFYNTLVTLNRELYDEKWDSTIKDHKLLNFLLTEKEEDRISNFKSLITYQNELQDLLLDKMKEVFLEYKNHVEEKSIGPGQHLAAFIMATTAFSAIRIFEHREKMFLQVHRKLQLWKTFNRNYSIVWIKSLFDTYKNSSLKKILKLKVENLIVEGMQNIKFDNEKDGKVYRWHLICMYILKKELQNKDMFKEILDIIYLDIKFFNNEFLDSLLIKINELYIDDPLFENWVTMIKDFGNNDDGIRLPRTQESPR